MAIYSHSRIETFETCHLKYKFRYIDKIEKAEEGIEAFTGSRVHEALAKLYKDLILGKVDNLEEVLTYYEAQWRHEWGPHVLIQEEGLRPDTYLHYGEECIRNFYEAFKPFDQDKTLGVELQLRFPLDLGDRYKMLSYVDRVACRRDGTYEIHDYKTGRSLPSQEEVDTDRQLGLYEIGLKSYWPDVERVELVWHYVGFQKTFRSRRTSDQLQKLRDLTIGAIQSIEGEKAFEPSRGNWCAWCEYRPECPLWKHVEEVRNLPREQFSADEGVQLANQYAQTKFEIDRLQEQLDSFRESVVQYARQRHIRVLQGDGVRVGVKLQEVTKFPAASDPRRGELEELIKHAGRWEEVSALQVRELAKLFEGMKWPRPLLHQLRPFATREESASVRVTRTRGLEEDDA